jgi:hypothetical protein
MTDGITVDSTASLNRSLTQLLINNELPGQPVTRFIVGLCEQCPKIIELRFRTYLPTANLNERLKGKETIPPDLLTAAKETAIKAHISLWDALACNIIRNGVELPGDLLAEILAHPHGDWERSFVLRRQEVLDGGISSLIANIHTTEGLALCSQVRTLDGHAEHIPMLDFACARTDANLATISAMLEAIGQRGVVVYSGNSYHFVGATLLSNDEWVRFMGRALLLAPFVDGRFIAHRLLDGECCLRVFAQSKAPQTPLIESCIFRSG